jgi:thioredoxin 1
MKIVRFTASWCQPCKMLAKILDDIENKPNIEVVDIDEDTDKAVEFGIRGVPTLVKLDDDNNVVDRLVGVKKQDELEKWLNG